MDLQLSDTAVDQSILTGDFPMPANVAVSNTVSDRLATQLVTLACAAPLLTTLQYVSTLAEP